MTATKAKTRCPYCKSTKQILVRCEKGPHYAKLVCTQCGRILRWAPTPMTLERAASFRMPFGQYEGKSLKRIASKPKGRRDLCWLIDQGYATGNMLAAIRLILEQRSAKASHLPGDAGPPPDERKAEPALQNSGNQTQKKKRRGWAN